MKKSRTKHTAVYPQGNPDSMVSLASGMTDNFNNILTTVMGACSLIDKDDPANMELLQYVALIRASAERAVTLSVKLTRAVAQENDTGADCRLSDAVSAATSKRDKKTIHDIVPIKNHPDGGIL